MSETIFALIIVCLTIIALSAIGTGNQRTVDKALTTLRSLFKFKLP